MPVPTTKPNSALIGLPILAPMAIDVDSLHQCQRQNLLFFFA